MQIIQIETDICLLYKHSEHTKSSTSRIGTWLLVLGTVFQGLGTVLLGLETVYP